MYEIKRAISDPIFFRPSGDGTLPSDVDSVFSSMLGELTHAANEPVGIFWEMYNITPADSLRLRIRVPPINRGIVSRIADALHVVDITNEVAISWNYRDARNAAVGANSGEISIVPSALKLNFPQFSSGDYEVTVAVTSRDRGTATSSRVITIRDSKR